MNKYLLLFLLIVIITIQFLPGVYFFVISAVIISMLIAAKPSILRRFRSKVFWIFLLLITFIQPAIIGMMDSSIMGIGYSYSNFILGLKISVRAIVIMSGFSYIFSSLNKDDLKLLFRRLPIKNYEPVFTESQSMFPKVKEAFNEEIRTIEIKRLIKSPVSIISGFLAKLISPIINSSDEWHSSDE